MMAYRSFVLFKLSVRAMERTKQLVSGFQGGTLWRKLTALRDFGLFGLGVIRRFCGQRFRLGQRSLRRRGNRLGNRFEQVADPNHARS